MSHSLATKETHYNRTIHTATRLMILSTPPLLQVQVQAKADGGAQATETGPVY